MSNDEPETRNEDNGDPYRIFGPPPHRVEGVAHLWQDEFYGRVGRLADGRYRLVIARPHLRLSFRHFDTFNEATAAMWEAAP